MTGPVPDGDEGPGGLLVKAVDNLASAWLCGGDPIGLARLDGPELTLQLAALRRANEARIEELTQHAKLVGSHVAEVIGKMFG